MWSKFYVHEFTVRVVKRVEEVKQLLEVGFEYVTEWKASSSSESVNSL